MAKVGSPFENACILTAVGVVVILINSAIITRWGRRRIFLMTGMILCGVCQLIVAAVYTVDPGTRSTGQVSHLLHFTIRSEVFPDKDLPRSSWEYQSSTSSATMVQLRHTHGSVAVNSPLSACVHTHSVSPLPLASSALG